MILVDTRRYLGTGVFIQGHPCFYIEIGGVHEQSEIQRGCGGGHRCRGK